MNLEQLRALAAVVTEGSFEGAAYRLGVSPSAVSQRIRALERVTGQVVVRRTSPCVPTQQGQPLVRLARHLEVLEAEAWAHLGQDAGLASTSFAVTADSLGTWFAPVLADAATWIDTTIDMHVEDQDHSAELLRRGEVLAAVTADPQPVNGCRAEPLGSLAYAPSVEPRLLERFTTDGGVDLDRLPMVRFNAKDDLQHRALRAMGADVSPPEHVAPSFDGFFKCVRAGLGWGMLVASQAEELMASGAMGRLPGADDVVVPLYWQTANLPSERLERLTRSVRDAARQGLLQD